MHCHGGAFIDLDRRKRVGVPYRRCILGNVTNRALLALYAHSGSVFLHKVDKRFAIGS